MAKTKAVAAKSTPIKSSAKPATGKSTALATTNKQTALSTDVADLVAASAGQGMENIGRDDMAIPRIAILQSMSPQTKKSDPLYIKGAEEGDFFDNVKQEVICKGGVGFIFIPAAYRRANLEWIPQNKGGGFIADHGLDDSILQKTKKDETTGAMLLPNGHEIVTTMEFVGIALTAEGEEIGQVAISLAKTQLKKGRRLNTLLTTLKVPHPSGSGTINPAMCYSYFKATTVPEQNDKGSWMGWLFTREGDTLQLEEGADLFRGALALNEAVSKGTVQVAAPMADVPDGDSDTL